MVAVAFVIMIDTGGFFLGLQVEIVIFVCFDQCCERCCEQYCDLCMVNVSEPRPTTPAMGDGSCPRNWEQWGDNCYYFGTTYEYPDYDRVSIRQGKGKGKGRLES